ncbi:MAG: ABC transporter ATP-binding protein [Planctomycetes bacterium]|nr:ABC transporter ATP-binding protein [Planctomycetota bacterium]
MGETPAVVAENLTKTYQLGRHAVPALRGVDLVVAEGEFVALMGPSGCGKTTLLNLIGLLDVPTRGRIEIGGEDVTQLSDDRLSDLRRDRIGFVFQFYNLMPQFTARENVEVPLRLAGVSRRERRVRTDELLAQVGLADRADHLPSELSGGEQQRVTIARALANRPKLLLLDEPTGDLDSASSHEVMGILSRLNQDQRATFLIVTHQEAVAEHASRVVRLLDGKVVVPAAENAGLNG